MDCIFCKIASGEIPCEKVFEDDQVIAFRDLNPQAPEHVLVIPKIHVASISEADASHHKLLGHIQLKIAEIARLLKIDEKGYRVVTNIGTEGGQTVGHLHYHVLGGRTMQWPPG